MKSDSIYANYNNDYSRSNHYYSLACQEANVDSSKSLLEEAIFLNGQNYDAKIDLIFLDNLPIKKEVKKLVSLYEEIKKELITSSFFKNKQGVFALHEEGKAFLRLINHIIDDYCALNNAVEIIKYAKLALTLDSSDLLEIKKYLAFSYLSITDFSSYLKLKDEYPNKKIFLFTDCYFYILQHKYVEAYQLALKLKDENNWIANYILFNESKNIINIYNCEKETPVSISLSIDFIISSFLIGKEKMKEFHLFVASKLLKTYSLTLDEKRILCYLFNSSLKNNPPLSTIEISTLSNLKNTPYSFMYDWLIKMKGSEIVSSLETLQNKGIIFSYNEGYKFTYTGIRLLTYFKEEKIIQRLFKK